MRGHGRFHTARPLKSVSVFVLYVITLCHYVETDIKYTLLKLCGKSCFFEISFRFNEDTLSHHFCGLNRGVTARYHVTCNTLPGNYGLKPCSRSKSCPYPEIDRKISRTARK
jgi:hypothetical protein